MTTKATIGGWFDRGVKEKATHMLIVCDTYDNEDYPVFVYPNESVREEYDECHGKNMQEVMEVYDLRMDKDAQLNEFRAFHF